MHRTLPILLATAATLAALPATANAAVNCSYNGTTHRLLVTSTVNDEHPQLKREGNALAVYRKGTPIDCSGPDATVTNTDKVEIEDSSPNGNSIEIYLSGGPFAPGFTGEGQFGTPEIEIVVAGGGGWDLLYIEGGAAADDIRAGTAEAVETRVNLNPTDLIPDSDVNATGIETLTVMPRGGGDTVDARGGAGTMSPLAHKLVTVGDDGDDKLFGGTGVSVLDGRGGADVLTGGAGPDTVNGGEDDDTLTGGDGEDTLAFDTVHAGIEVDLRDDDPQVTGQGTDTIDDFEHALGTFGDDTLIGSDGANVLQGRSGEDTLEGHGGDDTLDGDEGRDTVTYRWTPNEVTVDLGAAAPQATSSSSGDDTLADVEGVIGSVHDDTITGDGGDNRLDGGRGGDTISGLGGDDTLVEPKGVETEADGADVFDGGTGEDTLDYSSRTGPVAIRLDGSKNEGYDPNGDGISSEAEEGDHAKGVEDAIGGGGPDRLRAIGDVANALLGGGGDDRLDGGEGSDVLDGGGGTDTLSYAGRDEAVAVRLDGVKNDGADPDGDGISEAGEEADHAKAVENATGGNGPDRLRALGTAANVLTGGPGDDRLDGGPGTDVLDGGSGSDTISYAGRVTGVVVWLDGMANDGADGDESGVSTAGEEADQDKSIEHATGGDGPDRLHAFGGGVNVLTGGPGTDLLDAKNGTTTVDVLKCGSGNDEHASDASDSKDSCETAAAR